MTYCNNCLAVGKHFKLQKTPDCPFDSLKCLNCNIIQKFPVCTKCNKIIDGLIYRLPHLDKSMLHQDCRKDLIKIGDWDILTTALKKQTLGGGDSPTAVDHYDGKCLLKIGRADTKELIYKEILA